MRKPRSALEDCMLFRHFSRRQLSALAVHTTQLCPPAGLTLVAEGQRAREFIVVSHGEVELTRAGALPGRVGSPTTFGGPQIRRQDTWPFTLVAGDLLEILVLHQNAYLWAAHRLAGWLDLPDGGSPATAWHTPLQSRCTPSWR